MKFFFSIWERSTVSDAGNTELQSSDHWCCLVASVSALCIDSLEGNIDFCAGPVVLSSYWMSCCYRTTWRISTSFSALVWEQSDFLRAFFSAFSWHSDWPLCWWPNSKLILSSPIWQRGRTSGIHWITKGLESFWSPEFGPGNKQRKWRIFFLNKQKKSISVWDLKQNKRTEIKGDPYRLWGKCGAPLVVWPGDGPPCIRLSIPAQAATQGG